MLPDVTKLLSALNGASDGTELVDLFSHPNLEWHPPLVDLPDEIPDHLRDAARLIDLLDVCASSERVRLRLTPGLLYLRTGIRTRVNPDSGNLVDSVTGEDYSYALGRSDSFTQHPIKTSSAEPLVPGGTLNLSTTNGVRLSSEDIYPSYLELYSSRAVPDPYDGQAPSRGKLIQRVAGIDGELDQFFKQEIIALFMGLATGVALHVVEDYGLPGRTAPDDNLAIFTESSLERLDNGAEDIFIDDWTRLLAR